MAIGFVTALRTTRAEAIRAAMNAGATGATLKLYTTGSGRPATGAAISDQTLLGTLTFATDCGLVTNGVLTFAALVEDSAADNSGTATWCRIADSDGNFVMDMSVSMTGGGGDVTMNDNVLIAGGMIQGTATRTITEGNA